MRNLYPVSLLMVFLCLAAGVSASEEIIQETEFGFSQKGGMMPVGSHSIYFRTNDEFTGFSTAFIGYRYGLSQWFQFSIEAGIGIGTYIGALQLHFQLYESPNDRFFLGLRSRNGFKYQDTYIPLGDVVLDDHRMGLYTALDLTAAVRLGQERRWVVYYSIYPLFDFDFAYSKTVEIYFSPIHIGFEFVFGKRRRWSFAYEFGYFFAVNDVPQTSWFNFPNLANIGLFYRF